MNRDRFWSIIADTRTVLDPKDPGGNRARQVARLRAILEGMSAEELVAFHEVFNELMCAAYRWDLWGVAYIILGGCSDDCFIYFQGWLISMGKVVYEEALRSPESLVAFLDEYTSFEEILPVAREVFEEKTGEELPEGAVDLPAWPTGRQWKEEDLPYLFPRVWAECNKDAN